MTKVKFVYVFGAILYTIIATYSAPYFKIHWIHILNTLMLGSIFYNLLDFKFNCEEEK